MVLSYYALSSREDILQRSNLIFPYDAIGTLHESSLDRFRDCATDAGPDEQRDIPFWDMRVLESLLDQHIGSFIEPIVDLGVMSIFAEHDVSFLAVFLDVMVIGE